MMTLYTIFICFSLFGVLWWVSNRLKINKYLIFFLFSVKICASIVFLQVYIPDQNGEVHASDAHAYFFEGKVLNSVWDESPSDYFKLLTGIGSSEELEFKYLEEEVFHWSHRNKAYNDNENIIRLNSLIHFYSLNNPLIHAVTFSFLSLIGFILLALFIEMFSGISNRLILLTLVLLPSTLFWTSSILKEPMVIFGIGCSLALFLKLKNYVRYPLFIIGIATMLLFKPYILLFLTPGIIIGTVFYFLPTEKIYTPILMTLAGLTIAFSIPKTRDFIIFKTSKQQFDFNNISRGGVYFEYEDIIARVSPSQYEKVEFNKEKLNIKSEIIADIVMYEDRISPQSINIKPSSKELKVVHIFDLAKSYNELTQFDSVGGMISLAPQAFWNGFIRPFPWDSGRFSVIAFFETLFLLGLVSITILRRHKLSNGQKTIVFVCGLFFLILIYLTGLTTPSFGAIIRYRIPAHWALVAVVFIMIGGRRKVISHILSLRNNNPK